MVLFNSNLTTSALPNAEAIWSGVQPFSSTTLISSLYFTISVFSSCNCCCPPLSHTQWITLRPQNPGVLMSILHSSTRNSTTLLWPFSAAKWRSPLPPVTSASIFAPSVFRALKTATRPQYAAWCADDIQFRSTHSSSDLKFWTNSLTSVSCPFKLARCKGVSPLLSLLLISYSYFCTSARTSFMWPAMHATCKGSRPLLSSALGLQLYSLTSIFMTSSCPPYAAECSADNPFKEQTCRSAPRSINAFTTLVWPLKQAQCSGVKPALLAESTNIPVHLPSTLTASSCPQLAAM